MARGSAYCKGCVYRGIVQGSLPCCNYIFMEDKRRPCPPGEGCTVKTTNREAQRKGAEERKQRKLEQMKQSFQVFVEQEKRGQKTGKPQNKV